MRTEKEYLIVGKITKPFGIRGEVKVLPITDDPLRYAALKTVYIGGESRKTKTALEYAKVGGRFVVARFEGCSTVEDAERLRGELLYVTRDEAVPLEEGSYYHYDLNGCTVETVSGETVGMVYDIQNRGSCDVYSVRSEEDGTEYFIPAIRDVVKEIDTANKRIVIEPVEGLF